MNALRSESLVARPPILKEGELRMSSLITVAHTAQLTTLLVFLCAGLSGCGDPPARNMTCAATFSGASSGSCDCGAGGVTSTKTGKGYVLIQPGAGSCPLYFQLIAYTDARLGAFSDPATTSSGYFADKETATSGPRWVSGDASDCTSKPCGHFSVSITGRSSNGTLGTAEGWAVDGSADATYEAVTGTGATGTISLHADF